MKYVSMLGVLLWSMASFAQVNVVQEPDKLIYRKKTLIDFTGVVQDGERTAPGEAYALAKPRAHFQNLIKVRQNFTPELRNSPDDL
jgi:hypothetical protein